MKVYQTNEIKNIALLGNDGSGKTTLTEALLFESGIINVAAGLLPRIQSAITSRWSRNTAILCFPPFSMWSGTARN